MSYKVKTILLFDKQAKRLSKKYPSIKNDISILIKKLQDNPREVIPLGNNFYKIRLQIPFIFPVYTIKAKKKQFLRVNWRKYLKKFLNKLSIYIY